jgi:hypothetical protein
VLGEISRWDVNTLMEEFEDRVAPGTVPMRGQLTARQGHVTRQQQAQMDNSHLQLKS